MQSKELHCGCYLFCRPPLLHVMLFRDVKKCGLADVIILAYEPPCMVKTTCFCPVPGALLVRAHLFCVLYRCSLLIVLTEHM